LEIIAVGGLATIIIGSPLFVEEGIATMITFASQYINGDAKIEVKSEE
jgi:hypothetical protein